jgi:hypothetical protein
MRNKDKHIMKQLHSSFWLDDDTFIKDFSAKDKDPIVLAKYQRLISNFVRILTKKSIPVEYKTSSDDSYTDSKKIVIGSSISEKTFDSVVGLALHEASHIKLTDFTILPNLISHIRELGYEDMVDDVYMNSQEFRGLLNYVEDRRIDYYVYTTSPGYKGYYQSLYDRYFNDKVIDKALLSDEYRDNTIESYMFRVINLTNENSDLTALPGLRKIHNIIFSNVSKIKSTEDSLKVALEVYKVIMESLLNNQEESGSAEKSESSESSDDTDGMETKGSGSDSLGEEENQQSEPTPSEQRPELTPREKTQLPKKIQKQQDFLNGDVVKGKITKQLKNTVDSISDSDNKVVEVEYDDYWGKKKVEVLILRGMSEKNFSLFYNMRNKHWVSTKQEYVNRGISLGKRLGRKLQIRNYETRTDINRQKKGRIEKRRLHAIGAGESNIFYQTNTEKHADAFLHLSIDGSGSMSGRNFNNSLLSAVAIAQMGTMTNLDVQISIRYTEEFGGKTKPIMWVVYDSRKDSINTIKKNFYRLETTGVTPEGLCFDSIMKELPVGSDSLKTYFINYSDGEPYFQGYGGSVGVEHTRKQVNKIRNNGYKVLSFFLDDGGYSNKSNFETMYGKDAVNIDPTSLPKLVKQLQTMFINEK